MTWTLLNKSHQLHDASIGHARKRHWLVAAKLGRLVHGQFSTHLGPIPITLQFENSSLRTEIRVLWTSLNILFSHLAVYHVAKIVYTPSAWSVYFDCLQCMYLYLIPFWTKIFRGTGYSKPPGSSFGCVHVGLVKQFRIFSLSGQFQRTVMPSARLTVRKLINAKRCLF